MPLKISPLDSQNHEVNCLHQIILRRGRDRYKYSGPTGPYHRHASMQRPRCVYGVKGYMWAPATYRACSTLRPSSSEMPRADFCTGHSCPSTASTTRGDHSAHRILPASSDSGSRKVTKVSAPMPSGLATLFDNKAK
ncbi:hypothetical protein SCLCIDRAFT_927546 [Scleroderma citrinum Foug A]|uniref:Uncharacterized protein n=1 Tax=Scleroderma citrinum Foug A TaxID=1036808 RepID=A0A0C2ZGF2_9AGAM|nr:hypothetical protein SCLCIDRAFT_927546 [Scleroderma citrinum Foug A]